MRRAKLARVQNFEEWQSASNSKQAPAKKMPINAETGPKDQLAESIANSRAMDDRATKAAKDTARKGSGGSQ
jgi:hypothetical protein